MEQTVYYIDHIEHPGGPDCGTARAYEAWAVYRVIPFEADEWLADCADEFLAELMITALKMADDGAPIIPENR